MGDGLPWVWGDPRGTAAPPTPEGHAGRQLTRAVWVAAPPAVVFRWLVQLQLAPYSYDLLDNWGRRSPRELVDGLSVTVGSPMMTIFKVSAVEPDRLLALELTDDGARAMFGRLVCCYQSLPSDGGTLLRCDLFTEQSQGFVGRARMVALAWGDLLMMRKQLLTLCECAERTALPGG